MAETNDFNLLKTTNTMDITDQSKLITDFREKYSYLGFPALAGKLSNAHDRQVYALSPTLGRHQIGSMRQDGDLNYVILKNEETDMPVVRFHERNSQVMGFEDGATKLVNNPTRYGMCEYYYPDGKLAGLEVYSGKPGAEGLLPMDSIYFDTKQNVIERPMFDVLFRKEHGLSSGPVLEYAPRIKEYNKLVRDLADEYVQDRRQFGPQDIRESIGDKPVRYLDMLSADVRERCEFVRSRFSTDYINFMNETFVYGKSESSLPGAESEVFNDKILGSLGIDLSQKQDLVLSDSERCLSSIFCPTGPSVSFNGIYGSSEVYGSFQSDIKVVVDKDVQGRTMSRRTAEGKLRQEMGNTWRITSEDSPWRLPHDSHMEFFYPDGTLCMSRKEHTGKPLCFDGNGNICDTSRALRSYRAAWGIEKNYIQISFDQQQEKFSFLKKNTDSSARLNACGTGFDSRILLMEVDGRPTGFREDLSGLKGKHTVRIHLDPSVSHPVPKDLLDGLDNIVALKVEGNDPNLHQFASQFASQQNDIALKRQEKTNMKPQPKQKRIKLF